MTGLDKYRKDRRTSENWGKCNICGEPTKARVATALQDKKVDDNGPRKTTYPTIDSGSASFCEKHAIEVYEAVVAIIRKTS